jgi:8-oxo-dGTP pyrophosphatase MutT (NUDIX family)
MLHAARLDRCYRPVLKGNRGSQHAAAMASVRPQGGAIQLMMKPSSQARRQYGALPVLLDSDGRLRVMLVTSRETARWIIPKGWPLSKVPARKVAEREALEEAGLVGKIISRKAIGSYHYQKQLASGASVSCEVKVFLLGVKRQLETWPEKGQRKTRWFDPEAAASLVQEPALADILRSLGNELHGRRSPLVIRAVLKKTPARRCSEQ